MKPIIHTFSGSPKAIGEQMGRAYKLTLKQTLEGLLETVDTVFDIDTLAIDKTAMRWYDTVVDKAYKQTLEALASAASCSLETIVKSYYFDQAIGGCTAFLTRVNGRVYVAKNNDLVFPDHWHHVNHFVQDGKHEVALFGLPASVYSGTGINDARMYIDYNHVTVEDAGEGIPPFVFVRRALETCASIDDVERLLEKSSIRGGMHLFVVDGKREEAVVFEHNGKVFHKTTLRDQPIVRTNHTLTLEGIASNDSLRRYDRVCDLLKENPAISEYRRILADAAVEKRAVDSITVYSVVANMSSLDIQFAATPSPSASKGEWDKAQIPFASLSQN